GTIYAGAAGDIGYLRPDGDGIMAWRSLLEFVDEGDRDFRDVWHTFALENRIAFVTRNEILLWDGSTMDVVKNEEGFHTAFLVNGRLIVRIFGLGLAELVGNDIVPIAGGSFYSDKRVYALLEIGDGDWMVGTREHGLFILGDH